MIVSNLQNSQRVEKLHPLFKQLFDYVKSVSYTHLDVYKRQVEYFRNR